MINVPVDVKNMVSSLPRQLDDDYAFNVSIKKRIIHKSSYLSGFVKMGTVKAWLRYLASAIHIVSARSTTTDIDINCVSGGRSAAVHRDDKDSKRNGNLAGLSRDPAMERG